MTMNPLVTEGRKEEARIVADADRSARFEWDYLDVIKTLFGEGFRIGAEAIRAAGLTFQWEPYSGPFNLIAGSALADLPMGEFWTGGQGGIDSTIAAAGRAAGRRVIGAESFTGMPPLSRWTETPAFLKSSGDGTYACGVNRLVLHHWVHQPFDEKYKPGIGMGWWGTHFSRNQTWFEPGKAYFAYLGRAQALLQRGEGVADFLALDHAPAGADAVPTAALLNGDLRVKDGVIVLPSGRRYPFLQLPPGDAMLPEVARALKKLVAAGGVIAGPKPVRSPSLSGYPAADAEVKKLGEELWSNPKVLTKAVIPAPPLTTPGADIRTTARKDGETDIFFLANTGDEAREFTASFRVTGKLPELWQAEDGTSRAVAVWKTTPVARNSRCASTRTSRFLWSSGNRRRPITPLKSSPQTRPHTRPGWMRPAKSSCAAPQHVAAKSFSLPASVPPLRSQPLRRSRWPGRGRSGSRRGWERPPK